MGCERFSGAIPPRMAQVSMCHFPLRFQTRGAVCSSCSASARHPFIPRIVLPFSIPHFHADYFFQHPTPFHSAHPFTYPYPHYRRYILSSPRPPCPLTAITLEATLPASPALPSPAHGDVEMKEEEAAANALLALADSRCEQWNMVVDGPLVDPISSVPGSLQLPTSSRHTGATIPFHHAPPPTQRWPFFTVPLPPVMTTFEHSTQTPGGHLDSPPPPLFSHRTPARKSVPLAELVDEEGSSPGTRGGMRSFPSPATTQVNVSLAQSYPPISISIVDVTPSTRKVVSGAPEVPEIRSLRSSPLPPPETPDFFTTPAPAPSRSPLTSPARNNRRRGGGKGNKPPRRSKRKGAPSADHEAPDLRVTRSSSVKGQATEDFGTRAASPFKRARTSSP